MTAPYYQDDAVTVLAGDCLDVLPTLPDASVDAVVCDPPYGLEFMGKEWDSFAGDAWRNTQGITRTGYSDAERLPRPSYGGGDNANPTCATCGGRKRGARKCECTTPEWRVKGRPLGERNNNAAQMRAYGEWCERWAAECLRVLKPGGHLLAFGGTRTYHRIACAVEDVGFEVRDSISWLYGSGFPKSLDVSKAIDKRGGRPDLAHTIGAQIKAAREARGITTGQADRTFCNGSTNWTWFEGRKGECRPPTPATFARIAAAWPELAPLAELIAEAEREVIGRSAHRSGIANGAASHYTVGGTLAEHVSLTAPATAAAKQWEGWGTALKPAHEPIVVARKSTIGTVAANVAQYGTGALNIDGCRVATPDGRPAFAYPNGAGGSRFKFDEAPNRPDAVEGHAAGRWPANVVLDESQAAALDEQSGVTVSRIGQPRGAAPGDGWGMTNTGSEYADTGGASRFFPTFRYEAKAPTDERPTANGVQHPTVKPLDLMRWLVRLVTPPGGLVLDPFAGSGTTAEACVLEHFRCITIEREADYLPLIRARLTKPLHVGFDFGEETA